MRRRVARFHDGLCVPSTALPDDPDPNAGGGGGADPDPSASTPGITKTDDGNLVMTPEALAARATREKAEGKRAGIREITEQVNMSPAELVEFVKAKKAQDEAAKSEEQKRQDALAAKEREIADREAKAVARERDAARRAVLVGLGALGDDLNDAAALLGTRISDDADDAATLEAAAKLKETRPELFTAKTTTTTTSSTPAAPPNSRSNGNTEFGADGAAEATRRFAKQNETKPIPGTLAATG